MTEGHELIGKLLYTLQVYKSSGSYDRARKLYDDYSSVSDHFLKYRDIVISKRRPGYLRSYPNLELISSNSLSEGNSTEQTENGNKVEIKEYEESINGLISSFADRYPFNEKLFNDIYS